LTKLDTGTFTEILSVFNLHFAQKRQKQIEAYTYKHKYNYESE